MSRVVVVARESDRELQLICRRADVDLVLPNIDPPEMKVSVQHALTHIQHNYNPAESDAWMLGACRHAANIVRHC